MFSVRFATMVVVVFGAGFGGGLWLIRPAPPPVAPTTAQTTDLGDLRGSIDETAGLNRVVPWTTRRPPGFVIERIIPLPDHAPGARPSGGTTDI